METLVAHATTLNMPGYVQNLATKVVNPSTNDATYLEQYYGTTGVTLQETVNQWFLGKVEPNAVDTCDGYAAEDPNNAYTNVGATGYTLFGPNGPSFTDVAQGSAGDCWFLASLAETAARDPQIIQNMFINNGNGTWTVRFYVNGAPDYVTVNDQLPVATADPSQWRLRLRPAAKRDPLGRTGGEGFCPGEPVGRRHHRAAGGRFLRSPEQWISMLGPGGDHGAVLQRVQCHAGCDEPGNRRGLAGG